MSFATRVQELIIDFPNPIVFAEHIGIAVAVCLVSAIPELTETHKSLLEYDVKISEASAKRKSTARERIIQLEKIETEAAAHKAAMAEKNAAIIKQKEASLRDKRVTESQSKSDVKVIHEQEKGKLKVVQAGEKQQFDIARQDTKHVLEQQETTLRTTAFSHLQKHLATMTDLTGELKEASEAAGQATKSNETAIKASQQSVMALDLAMGKIIAANLDLQKALSDYDLTVATGDEDIAKAAAISKALISAMQAEKKIESLIATTHIQHKSGLKQAFMNDVAEKNTALDDTLSRYSKQTLEKLSELIQAEISTAQEQIATLTESSDIDECETHLEKLLGMLDKVNQINLAKPEGDNISASSMEF